MTPLSSLRVYSRVVLRQLRRNVRRTTLTFSGLVISFFLYGSLDSLLRTLDGFIDQYASETMLVLRSRGEVGLFRPELPRQYAARLVEIPGVQAASAVRFHVGQGKRDGTPAIALGVDGRSFFETLRPLGLTLGDLERLADEPGGAWVGRDLLDLNGWEVGSRVTVRGQGVSPPLIVDVLGAIEGDDRFRAIMLVGIGYLEEVLGNAGRASVIQARIERPEFAAGLAQAIDARFANFSVPTQTTTQRTEMSTALSSVADAFLALRAIGYLTLGITVLVVGHSISMSIRERTTEIGTLRALGFARLRVAQMVIGESVVVALGGAMVGAAGVYALWNSGLVRPFGPVSLDIDVSLAIFPEVAALAVPIGVIASLPTLISALRMPIANALRAAL